MHGFTLDEKGNKMSKSLGNVISPKDVVEKKSLGVDVLRWWVALHASSSTSVMVGDSILMASKADVDRIRNSVRFILGLLDGAEEVEAEGEVRTLLDRSTLHRLHSFVNSCAGFYDAMEYSKVLLYPCMHNCKIAFPGLSCNQLVSSQLKLAVHAPDQRQDVL